MSCEVCDCGLLWADCKCWALLNFFLFIFASISSELSFLLYQWLCHDCLNNSWAQKVFGIAGWPWKGPIVNPEKGWLEALKRAGGVGSSQKGSTPQVQVRCSPKSSSDDVCWAYWLGVGAGGDGGGDAGGWALRFSHG